MPREVPLRPTLDLDTIVRSVRPLQRSRSRCSKPSTSRARSTEHTKPPARSFGGARADRPPAVCPSFQQSIADQPRDPDAPHRQHGIGRYRRAERLPPALRSRSSAVAGSGWPRKNVPPWRADRRRGERHARTRSSTWMKRERRRRGADEREDAARARAGTAAETRGRAGRRPPRPEIVHGPRASARTTASAASLLRPYAFSGCGASSSRLGRVDGARPVAAWLEMSISRAPVALAACDGRRVPSTLTASNSASVARARARPRGRRATQPSAARGRAHAVVERALRRPRRPSGSGFRLPGRTMARTCQPASRNASRDASRGSRWRR